jgi:GPH family glycoside/pentoside/hexuronide:cation symporter
LLWGAIPYGICGYLMFAGPNLDPNGKLVYAYITYALMLTSYTVINVPYSSLLGVISPSSRTRTVASSFRFVGAFAGALLISLFVRPLVKHLGGGNEMRGFQWTMAIFAVASVLMFWTTFAATRERVTPPPGQKTNVKEELRELLRNWPWVMLLITSIFSTTFVALRSGSTLFYYKYVVGDDGSAILFGLDRSTVFLTTGALGLVLGTACLGPIARKIDKKYYAAALSAITGVCFAAFFIVPRDAFGLQLALNALAQFCAGPTSALTWALYGDVADYGEWKFGRRSTGLVYSASLFAIKTGIVMGGFLLPLFLDQFGFVRNQTQTATATLGITLAFSLAPGLLALLKAGALMIYPLDQKRVDEIERELAVRRAASSVTNPA